MIESYRPLFDPSTRPSKKEGDPAQYVYRPEIELAVNVALATRRPLLLRGEPGTGKSSLAYDVALCKDWRFEMQVISSRTQAQDLQWRFDAVSRLADVQAGRFTKEQGVRNEPYVEPGVLWRAFDPASAVNYGSRVGGRAPAATARGSGGVVVLLDEIDKADPDVPNDLLVVLDAKWFRVVEVDLDVAQKKEEPALILITTNGERDLPPAFVRRCVVLELRAPTVAERKAIARSHFPDVSEQLLDELGGVFDGLVAAAKKADLRAPSTAEFIDALRACKDLQLDHTSREWTAVTRVVLWKHPPLAEWKREAAEGVA